MNELQAIWIRKDNIHLSKRIALYKQFVKPCIVYNCGTWAMQKADAESLDAFHRQQLWRVLGIRWPNHISNKKVYRRTGEYLISLFVLKQRWQLFGHILRSYPMPTANQAMKFYFEPSKAKGF